jgi:hypothetical protein
VNLRLSKDGTLAFRAAESIFNELRKVHTSETNLETDVESLLRLRRPGALPGGPLAPT